MSRASITAPAAATAGLLVPLALLDRRMQATGGPGIIPFELAGPDHSAQILRAWSAEGRRAARGSLLLDYPFLVAYTTLNWQLTARARDAASARGAHILEAAAPAVQAVQVAAGACDALENAALLAVLARGGGRRLANAARTAARAKFAGLIVGWLYGAIATWSRSRRA